ncbi:BspA family leucine-rich repeat surface protein [Fulvivirga lutimaris]|uniref:BspA family leucine-rich repeat surface protein n=1 Tax=Fulvivirga lutimaris TaxID=1819566 RepID=UPI001C8853DE|nr:BspA family leucine-rich repeat surface protein [Fulvivirga lutimaris]
MVFTPSPQVNANEVVVNSNIELDFDTDVDLITVHINSTNADEVYDDNIKIIGSQTGQFQGTFSFGADNSIVVFDPAISFKAGEKITVVVNTSVLGTGGEVAIARSFSFIAASGPFEGAFKEVSASGILPVTYGDTDWGDYDNDGDLDVAVIGWDFDYNEVAIIYNNDGGVFTDIGAGLTGVFYSSCEWGDYDGDGDLDLIVAGSDVSATLFTTIYQNNGGVFTDIGAGLLGVDYASVDWGDYDNDGDLDLAVAGRYDIGSDLSSTIIYRNDGGSFVDISAGLVGTSVGSIDWVDYDNDGDLDLFATGLDEVTGRSATIYRNDGSDTFVDDGVGLPGIGYSSADWGDYDNDGDLDLVMMGGQSTPNDGAYIYQNNSGVFTDIGAGLPDEIEDGSARWGDYDGDGDLDLLIVGQDFVIGDYTARIYNNDGGIFTNINAGLVGVAEQARSEWNDFDNDGDLDILITGVDNFDFNPSARIYENTIFTSFITTWKTDNPGSSDDNQITIPTTGSGYFYDVDWGDGMSDTGVTGNITHTYASAGTYTVSISGAFPRIYFNNGGFFGDDNDSEKILTIEQWGDIAWSSMARAFSGCLNLRINAADVPDLSKVIDMTEMFYEAEALNDNINNWDVSNVEIMNSLFRDATSFNQPLNLWVTDNVTDMRRMFSFASAFNQDIGGWNVINVEDMSSMFGGATTFNQDISGWTVTSVLTMNQMFSVATSFNQNIGGWTMTSVTNIAGMFNGATVFNQDIGGWDVSNVSSMITVFSNAPAFNQDISGWVVDGVNNMRAMFNGAVAFNQDISGWNVDNVGDMEDMFNGAVAFNQDISGWVVSGVGDMSGMFEGATSFNQDISGWDVSNVDDMRFMFSNATLFNQNLGGWVITDLRFALSMFNNSGLSIENYDATLIGWEAQGVLNVSLGASNIYYCAAEVERANLITNLGWTISDGGQGCIAVYDGLDTTAPEIINGQATPIDFGSVSILPANKTRNITILNRTVSDLTNVNVTISGTVFSIVPAAPATITASTSATINVVLSGNTPGVFTETVSITSDDFSGTFSFDLVGEITATPEPEIVVYEGNSITGTEIIDDQLSPYDFGSELRGNNLTADITITNIGSTSLDISNMSITGTAFSFASITPASVAVGATETVQIILDGSVAGVFSETLTINNNDTDEGTFNFDIEGEIIGPDIAVFQGTNIFSSADEIFDGQATSLDFGTGPQGVDIVRQITIANFNPLALNVSDISISGSAFSINAITPFSIAAEVDGIITRTTFDITLSGAVDGTFNESIIITNDDEDEPTFTFPLSGQIGSGSPEIALFNSGGAEVFDGQPAPVDFGSEVQGTGINETLTIQNQGTADLTISAINISGTAFTLNSAISFPLVIGASGNQLVDILLTGNSIGVFTETVTVLSDDADEGTFDFEITGEITAPTSPEIAVFLGTEILDGQAAAIDIGNVVLGSSTSQTFTVNNTGSADLIVSDLTISGATFSSPTTTPFVIIPGGSSTFEVVLDAVAAGSFTETVTVTNNDADEGSFEFNITGEVTAANSSPTISPIADAIIDEDGSTGNLPFTINDVETNLDDLIVTASSNNTALVASTGIALSGSGGNRTINVTPESDINGTVIITVQVDDGQAVASETFTLTVVPVNDAPVITGQSTLTTLQSTSITLGLDNFSVTDIDNTYPDGFSLLINDGTNFTVNGAEITPNSEFVGDLVVPIVINDGQDDSPVFNTTITVEQGELSVDVGGAPLTNGSIVNFDDVPVGAEDSRELIITNNGTVALVISAIVIAGDDFILNSAIPDPILPSESSPLSISFRPSSIGPKAATITISSQLAADFIATLNASGLSEAPPLEIFNVVTTQQNGKHDFLEIRNIEFYQSNKVFIYNRWGNEVFKTAEYNNTDNNFIGNTSGGDELPDGTYYYVIELNGGEKVENGFFLLRR